MRQGQHQATEVFLVRCIVAVAEPRDGLDALYQGQDVVAVEFLDPLVRHHAGGMKRLQHYGQHDIAVRVDEVREFYGAIQCAQCNRQPFGIARRQPAVTIAQQRLYNLNLFVGKYAAGDAV